MFVDELNECCFALFLPSLLTLVLFLDNRKKDVKRVHPPRPRARKRRRSLTETGAAIVNEAGVAAVIEVSEKMVAAANMTEEGVVVVTGNDGMNEEVPSKLFPAAVDPERGSAAGGSVHSGLKLVVVLQR